MPTRVLSNPWRFPWEAPVPPPGVLPPDAWFSTSLAVEVQTRPKGLSKKKAPWPTRLSPRDLLLCSGLAQSPAWSVHDRRAWAFLIEHSASFEPRAGILRIVDESQEWDARIRTLFAERIGLGFTVWHLWRVFGVVHVADAAPFISKALLDPSSPYHTQQLSITGPYGDMRPDFLCLTDKLEAVLAESKGALGPPSAISANEKLKAKQQLMNVTPIGVKLRPFENRLAFATNLRMASDKCSSTATDTGVYVEDPEADPSALTFDASPDEIVINAYSKILHFLGNDFLAYMLRRGVRPLLSEITDAAPDTSDYIETIQGERILILRQAFGHRFGLPLRAATALFNGTLAGVANRIADVLAESPLVQSATRRIEQGESVDIGRFVLPNGLVGIPF
jgi:hypothetical protein